MSDAIWIRDDEGNYHFPSPVDASQVLDLAASILESSISRGDALEQPTDAARLFKLKLGLREIEVFAVAWLDNRHRLIQYEELFFGTISGASVYPREVVRRAIQLNAAAVVLSHNHPSGVAEPSQADIAITRRLKEALGLIDTRVLDHLIIGGDTHVSMSERGLI